jgi:hypothetical protein
MAADLQETLSKIGELRDKLDKVESTLSSTAKPSRRRRTDSDSDSDSPPGIQRDVLLTQMQEIEKRRKEVEALRARLQTPK